MPCRKLIHGETPPNGQIGYATIEECNNSTECGCPEGQMRWWETIKDALGWTSIDDCFAMEGEEIPRSGGLVIGQFESCNQCVVAQIYGAECYFSVDENWECPPDFEIPPERNPQKCLPEDWYAIGLQPPPPTYTPTDPTLRGNCNLKPKDLGVSGVIVEGGLFGGGYGVEFSPGQTCEDVGCNDF